MSRSWGGGACGTGATGAPPRECKLKKVAGFLGRRHRDPRSCGHSPWKLSTACLFVSSSLKLMSDSWMGACGQRGWARGLGPAGQVRRPGSPHCPLYLAVLHQAGHGLLSISTGLGWPEGARGGHPHLLSPPTPIPGQVWRVQRALAWGALSREACFRGAEDGLARGRGEGRKGTHRVWGFRK